MFWTLTNGSVLGSSFPLNWTMYLELMPIFRLPNFKSTPEKTKRNETNRKRIHFNKIQMRWSNGSNNDEDNGDETESTHMYWHGMECTQTFAKYHIRVQMNWISAILMLMLLLSSSSFLLLCVKFCCLKSFPPRWIVQSADFRLRVLVLDFFFRSLFRFSQLRNSRNTLRPSD